MVELTAVKMVARKVQMKVEWLAALTVVSMVEMMVVLMVVNLVD